MGPGFLGARFLSALGEDSDLTKWSERARGLHDSAGDKKRYQYGLIYGFYVIFITKNDCKCEKGERKKKFSLVSRDE